MTSDTSEVPAKARWRWMIRGVIWGRLIALVAALIVGYVFGESVSQSYQALLTMVALRIIFFFDRRAAAAPPHLLIGG